MPMGTWVSAEAYAVIIGSDSDPKIVDVVDFGNHAGIPAFILLYQSDLWISRNSRKVQS